MAIQTRRGNEVDFDASKMLPGEWAVSLDTKYVRMCFSPGVVYRMATYESFEEDMIQIQQILATCEDIQVAVEAFEELAQQHANDAEASATASANSATAASDSATLSASSATASSDSATLSESWAIGNTGERPGEDTNNAKYWSGVAQAVANVEIMTPTKLGIGKPDNITIGVSNGTFETKFKHVNRGAYLGDLNDIPVEINVVTAYRAARTCTNSPENSHGMVETMYIDSSPFAIQRFTALSTSRIWIRRKIGNVWASWVLQLSSGQLTNNLLATEAGTALDAVQGKALDTRVTANTTDIDTLNSNLPQVATRTLTTNAGGGASTGVNISEYIMMSAVCDGTTDIVVDIMPSGTTYWLIPRNYNTLEYVTNTEFSFTYTFIKR